ncbi:MAG: phosphoenolpyruvate synthase, partial [Myxococcales bacterium]|nr:phosphoenolpyruvate synthase [Myxococcales bacterium]
GVSLFQLVALRPMDTAGGRLFVDITQGLAVPPGRAALLAMMRRTDPLTLDALQTVLAGDLVAPVPEVDPPVPPPGPSLDPAVLASIVARDDATLADLESRIAGLDGLERLACVRADIGVLKDLLRHPDSVRAVMAGIEAAWWLDDHLDAWLGDRSLTDALTRWVPGNVSAEMGTGLLDVADAIRACPGALAALEERGLAGLPGVAGGAEVRAALDAFLAVYGVRCVGEIDVTRPRWSERPELLLPILLGHVRAFGPGEAGRRTREGREGAERAAVEVLERLRSLPDGETKALEAAAAIGRLRDFMGFRERPKHTMMRRFAVYRRALLATAADLVAAGVLEDPDDATFLTFDEVEEAVRTGRVHADPAMRRRTFRAHERLMPPRVLTSDGEALQGRHPGATAGQLVGIGASAGVAEGRARVVSDLAGSDLQPGDILVTRFTDPSWTPAFVTVAGLVTEVGGRMTHGAVVAREYGLPAVVGVVDVTRILRDGERIRIHGADGRIERLEESA